MLEGFHKRQRWSWTAEFSSPMSQRVAIPRQVVHGCSFRRFLKAKRQRIGSISICILDLIVTRKRLNAWKLSEQGSSGSVMIAAARVGPWPMSRVTNSAFTRAMWSTRVTAPTNLIRANAAALGQPIRRVPAPGIEAREFFALHPHTRRTSATPIPCSVAQASVHDNDTLARAQIGRARFASSHAMEITPTEIDGLVLGLQVPAFLGTFETVPGLRSTRMNHKTTAEGCTTKSSRPRWSSNHLTLRGDSWQFTIGVRSWRQMISDR